MKMEWVLSKMWRLLNLACMTTFVKITTLFGHNVETVPILKVFNEVFEKSNCRKRKKHCLVTKKWRHKKVFKLDFIVPSKSWDNLG
jgi:hypothetical protein